MGLRISDDPESTCHSVLHSLIRAPMDVLLSYRSKVCASQEQSTTKVLRDKRLPGVSLPRKLPGYLRSWSIKYLGKLVGTFGESAASVSGRLAFRCRWKESYRLAIRSAQEEISIKKRGGNKVKTELHKPIGGSICQSCKR